MVRVRTHIAGILLLFVFFLKVPASTATATYIFALKLGVFISIALWLAKIDIWAGAFLAVCILSSLFLGGRLAVLNRIILLSFWYLFLVHFVNSPGVIEKYICIALIVNVIWQIVQVTVGDPFAFNAPSTGKIFGIPYEQSMHPVGFLANKNATSCFIAIASIAMFRFRRYWMLLFIVPVAGLVLATSCIGFVVLGIAVVAYLLFLGKRKAAIAVLSVSAVFVFWYASNVNSMAVAPRVVMIEKTFATHFGSMLFGVGLGNFKIDMPTILEHYAHNEILHYTTELGIILPIIFIGWCVMSLRKYPVIPKVAIIAAGIASLSYFVLHNPLVSFLIVTWLAVGKIEYLKFGHCKDSI